MREPNEQYKPEGGGLRGFIKVLIYLIGFAALAVVLVFGTCVVLMTRH